MSRLFACELSQRRQGNGQSVVSVLRGGTGTPMRGLRAIPSVSAAQAKSPSRSSVRDQSEWQLLHRSEMRASPRLCTFRLAWPANPKGPLAHALQGAPMEVSSIIGGAVRDGLNAG